MAKTKKRAPNANKKQPRKASKAKKARQRARSEVLRNFKQYYVVYGADRPCNEFNNYTNADRPTPNPNCRDKTTSIGPPPSNFVPPDGGGNDAVFSRTSDGSRTADVINAVVTCLLPVIVILLGVVK